MSRDEWMQRFGGVLQSEDWFEKKAPGWQYDKDSWCAGSRVGAPCTAAGAAAAAGLQAAAHTAPANVARWPCCVASSLLRGT